MTGLITRFVRFCMMSRHAARGGSGIIPLNSVKKATVFVDCLEPDLAKLSDGITQFFNSKGIEVDILLNHRKNLTLFGCLKKKLRKERREDLFISLMPTPGCFASDYETACSSADFKVGRYQIRGNMIDMVINNSDGVSQDEVFKTVSDILVKIR